MNLSKQLSFWIKYSNSIWDAQFNFHVYNSGAISSVDTGKGVYSSRSYPLFSLSSNHISKVNANVPPHFLNIAYCYNGGQKNLGLCEKALTSNYWYVGLYAYWKFFDRLWVHSVVPPFPLQQCCGSKSSHFHPFAQNSTLFGVGKRGIASFTNITGKVATLLTSIAVIIIINIILLNITNFEVAFSIQGSLVSVQNTLADLIVMRF